MPATKVNVTTDGKTIWVNSAKKCLVRISGINGLHEMEGADGLHDLSLDGMIDVRIGDE